MPDLESSHVMEWAHKEWDAGFCSGVPNRRALIELAVGWHFRL